MNKTESKEKITILSQKDLEISYFCGSGPGGQARNKVASGVQMKHTESGAIGRASDSRSQHENKKAAFKRLLETPKMKFWLTKRIHEIRMGETLEEEIAKETSPENLIYEVKDENGKWIKVSDAYFDSSEAKQEEA